MVKRQRLIWHEAIGARARGPKVVFWGDGVPVRNATPLSVTGGTPTDPGRPVAKRGDVGFRTELDELASRGVQPVAFVPLHATSPESLRMAEPSSAAPLHVVPSSQEAPDAIWTI